MKKQRKGEEEGNRNGMARFLETFDFYMRSARVVFNLEPNKVTKRKLQNENVIYNS